MFNKLTKNKYYSLRNLIIFLVIFISIGTYVVIKSSAANPIVASLLADQMSLSPGSTIVSDSNASTGKAVAISAKYGEIRGSVNIPSTVTALSVTARSPVCSVKGSTYQTKMNVYLDSSLVVSVSSIGTSYTNYNSGSLNIPSGSHNLTIELNNPNTACSHVLYVDVTDFYGPTPPPPVPTVAISATPSTVNTGGSSTLTWSSTNATTCSASGAWSGTEPTSGSLNTGALNTNSTYSLTCTGTGGSATGATSITVNQGGGGGTGKIIGADGIGGWGPQYATQFTQAGINGERIGWVMPSSTTTTANSSVGEDAAEAISDGLNPIGLIMTPTGVNSQGQGIQEPLSQTNPATYAQYAYNVIAANPNENLWEIGNEQYFYGTAQQYGQEYQDVYNDVNGITQGFSKIPGKTLIFDMWGDYQLPNGTYSQDAGANQLGYSGGGGWLADAIDTNPALKNDIQAFSTHPYGGLSIQSDYCQPGGVEGSVTPYAIAGVPTNYNGPRTTCPSTQYCQPNGCSIDGMAQEYLGHVPPIYVTEYGIFSSDVGTGCTQNSANNGWSNCSSPASDQGYNTPCSTQQQGRAYLLTEALNIILSNPNVVRFNWYSAYSSPATPGADLGEDLVYFTKAYSPPGFQTPAFYALEHEENFNPNNQPQPTCNP